MKFLYAKSHIIAILVIFMASSFSISNAQIRESIEPPEMPAPRARTAYQEGLRTGFLGRVNLTDNGLGVGMELRRVIAPYTEVMFGLEGSGLRDSREQIFNSYY